MKGRSITIVGGGLTGIAVAIKLIQQQQTGSCAELRKLTIVEPKVDLGLGAAYSTTRPEHLLNVPAQGMSLFADKPNDFTAWLATIEAVDEPSLAEHFIPRQVYGRYVQQRFAEALAAKSLELEVVVVQDQVVALTGADDDWTLHTASGQHFSSGQVILCLGNFPPTPLPVFDERGSDCPQSNILQSPWDWQALREIDRNARVCLVGSGLTMVDVVLTLQANHHQGAIQVISRHGAMPQSHAQPLLPVIEPVLAARDSLRDAVRKLRQAIARDGAANDVFDWRQLCDSIRPCSQLLWRGWSQREQRQFLRHWASHWGVYRHRIAQPVWQKLQQLQVANSLTLHAGRIKRLEVLADGPCQVLWLPRGQKQQQTSIADVVVNCTGPSANLAKINSPLLQQLVADGYAIWDGLGVQVNEDSRVVDREQQELPSLLAFGPLTKGSLFEIIAVPDIRNQVAKLIVS